MSDILNGKSLESFFDIKNYSHFVTNSDITIYNTLIGGESLENEKIRGINEYVNEYNQIHSRDKNYRKLPKLKPLYKQILADRESLSISLEYRRVSIRWYFYKKWTSYRRSFKSGVWRLVNFAVLS